MVYGGIPERKTKLQHTPDIRGDQDNQDNPGKKQAYYPKFFVNEQQSDHKVHQLQGTSKSNLDQFSSFKSSSDKVNPANCLGIASLSLEHHKVNRKCTNKPPRDHSFLLPPPSASSSDHLISKRRDRQQNFSLRGYKTENLMIRNKETGIDETLEKRYPERSKSERKTTSRSLGSSNENAIQDAKNSYFLSTNEPELQENRPLTSFNQTQSKKDPTTKISKPGLLKKLGRNLFFGKNEEHPKREVSADASLTASERCRNYCSQVCPKDQVFLDEYPILWNGDERQINHQQTMNIFNSWNQGKEEQNLKTMSMIIKGEKMIDTQLDEENLRKIFLKMFQEKSENENKSYMSYSVDCSDKGNKDSLEIGYSISHLGRYCLQNSNKMENFKVTDTIVGGESWEHCLGWIRKVDLDTLSQGTNSSDSLGHAKPQGKLDIIKGIFLDIFVCICF